MIISPLPHERLLEPHEQEYHPAEKMLRIALRRLSEAEGSQGLSLRDRRNAVLTNCMFFPRPLSAKQVEIVTDILTPYHETIAALGLCYPTAQEMEALIAHCTRRAHVPPSNAAPGRVTSLDIRGSRYGTCLFLTIGDGPRFNELKNRFDRMRVVLEAAPYNGRAYYERETTKEWRITFSEAIFRLIISNDYFSTTFTRLSPAAADYKQQLDARDMAEEEAAAQATAKEDHEVEALVQCMGGMEGEVVPGIRLYQHQKYTVDLALRKKRIIIAHETGAGKTICAILPAKAMQQYYGARVYIVTTKSSIGMWRETCTQFGVMGEVIGWAQLPQLVIDNAHFPHPCVIIVDEAHRAAYMKSQRTKLFLALAELKSCLAFLSLTGTPVPNGRPINAVPMLLASHHAIVWDERIATRKQKIFEYEKEYCGRQRKETSRGHFTVDTNGCTNRLKWNRRVIYVPGTDNHPDALCISYLKVDCRDMPPKQRAMREVEVSKEAQAEFGKRVVELWERFDDNCKRKLAEYRAELVETHKYSEAAMDEMVRERNVVIRRSRVMVSYGIFKQAASWAKVDTVVEDAGVILDRVNDEGESISKLIIFTDFPAVAKEVGRRIEAEYKVHVGYILGESNDDEREAVQKDFQSNFGKLRVVICSIKAGGESINLNGTARRPCQYVIMMDRPWTPGAATQCEDRAWRINNTVSVSVFWMQMPASLTNADIHNDQVIQGKKANVDALQFGTVTEGLEFLTAKEIEENAEGIMRETYLRMKRGRKAA